MDQIEARAAEICAERIRVTAELRKAGYEVPDSQTNFVWLPLGAKTDDTHLALERQGLVTRSFSDDGLRVTIGTPDENDRFLAALPGP
jgi:histidinol-phosphate aminotransferase